MKTTILITCLLAAPLFAQPEIAFDSAPNFLKMPEHIYLGEVAGVATNSKGNVFVYTRTGTGLTDGGSRTFSHGGSRLFEFDSNGKYLREIGTGVYGFNFAEGVRVDPRDNIWVIDRGSSMVIEFDPEGRILMTLGRKPEAVNEPGRGPAAGAGRGAGRGGPGGPPPGGARAGGRGLPGAGTPGDNFNRPTDVAWDSAGDIFVSDGFGNARIAKFDKNGKFLKSWGSRGSDPGQMETPRSLAVDSQGNVYVADRGNKRIDVFDNDGALKTAITNVGAPWALCITPGPNQVLYSSDSNDVDSMDNGEIYRLALDGKALGKFGRAGKLLKEFGTVNEIDCRNPNQLYVGEIGNWRVQKLALRP